MNKRKGSREGIQNPILVSRPEKANNKRNTASKQDKRKSSYPKKNTRLLIHLAIIMLIGISTILKKPFISFQPNKPKDQQKGSCQSDFFVVFMPRNPPS